MILPGNQAGGIQAAASHPLAQLLAVWWLALAPVAMAAETTMTEGVLIVHSNQRPLPAGILVDETLRKVVPGELGRPVEFCSEFVDVERFATAAYVEAQAEFLRRKYADEHNIRVIVAVAPPAFQFMLDYRDRILPGVPVVYVAVPRDLQPGRELPPDFVGATVDFDPTATFELALRLQPAARRLVIVTGAADKDRAWVRRIRDAVGRLGDRLEVEYLAGLPTADVLRRLGALSRDTIVYTPGYFVDGMGLVITPRQSVEQMAAASMAPLYGPISTFVGAGAVGGSMSSYEDQAEQVGMVVVRLLNGAAPAVIPSFSMQNVPLVDWRQLRRWGIDERLLPSNTVVRFRQRSVWDDYWREISGGMAILVLQAALIAALLFERRVRKRIAAELEDSEQRINLVARAARFSMWIWDVAPDKVLATAPLRRSAGVPDEKPGKFDDVLESVHPADREEVRRAVREAVTKDKELNIEYRIVEPGGGVCWIAARGRMEKPSGKHLLGVSLDITERKAAELQATQARDALRHMSRVSLMGQLSASIAHQLNQPLAAILGNAEAACKMLGREPVDLAELREICNDIVTEDYRASEVIRRLGDLFKRGEMKREPLDVNGLARETLDLLRAGLLTRHVTAVTDLAPSLLLISADRVQLQQVLLNLILNAAEAMNGNAEAIRIVTIRTETAGDDIRLSVVDRGRGIAPENLKNVFDAFWSTKSDGMGMGLAICQSIVVAHGGSLTAINNPDRGATFCATLPVSAKA